MLITVKKLFVSGLLVFFLILVVLASILVHVHNSTDKLIFDFTFNEEDQAAIPEKPVAIVFGAHVTPHNMLPSDVLAYRIISAVNLYQAGKVKKIIMSGDNRTSHYNEPEVMMKYAVRHGVPEEDIVMDFAGRRTYDTCYRAKNIFQIDEAFLVTQRYHLYRALYTCNALGVNSIGMNADNEPLRAQTFYNIREIPATLLAVWQVHISRPEAQVMGGIEEVFPDTTSQDLQAS
ncbi:vancomycin high temperature exclusion protein [Patescibacteria group bacterium]